MPERKVVMTREEIERMLYQLDGAGKIMASLLMGISDRLDTLIEQNKKIIEQNDKMLKSQ